jgi:glycerophosphoryl diester phosphodiesterase
MLLVPSPLERIAHRGASRERLENTLPAFELALERGADAVELDTHVTRDGVVVVHHDDDVAGKALADLDWTTVAGMELAGGGRIPRLSDVLEIIGDRAVVYIELKGRGVEDAALREARRCGKRFAVHSFDHEAIVRSMRLMPDAARGVLLDEGIPDPVGAMTRANALTKPRDVWPHFGLVNAQFMEAAEKMSLRVNVWTVNSLAEAKRLTDLGVHGICTDDVRLLANLGSH